MACFIIHVLSKAITSASSKTWVSWNTPLLFLRKGGGEIGRRRRMSYDRGGENDKGLVCTWELAGLRCDICTRKHLFVELDSV